MLNFGVAEQENQEGGLSPQRPSPAHSAKSRRLSDQLSVADAEVKAPSGKRSQGSGASQRSEKSKESKDAKTPEQELAELMKELHVSFLYCPIGKKKNFINLWLTFHFTIFKILQICKVHRKCVCDVKYSIYISIGVDIGESENENINK